MTYTFKNKDTISLLSVPDNFFIVTSTQDDLTLRNSISLKLKCSVRLQASLNAKCQKIRVTVSNKQAESSSYQQNLNDSKLLVSNILNKSRQLRNTLDVMTDSVITETVIDITSKTNNADLKKISSTSQYKISRVGIKSVTAGSLQKSLDIRPVIDTVSFYGSDTNSSDDKKKLAYKMISKYGIAPTDITTLTTRELLPSKVKDGTLRVLTSRRDTDVLTDQAVALLNSYTFDNPNDVNDTSQIDPQRTQTVIEQITTDSVSLDGIVVINNVLNESTDLNYFVKFSLIRSPDGLIIDEIVKTMSVSQIMAQLELSVLPPKIKVNKTDTQTFLFVTQVDKYADGVIISKKNMSPYEMRDGYKQTIQAELKSGDSSVFLVDTPTNFPDLYRVSATVRNNKSSDFSDVVVKPLSMNSYVPSILTVGVTEKGLLLETKYFTGETCSVVFKLRDVSITDSVWTVSEHKQITRDVLTADHVSNLFSNLRPYHLYEVTVDMYQENGNVVTLPSQLIEYLVPAVDAVNTTVSDLLVIDNPQLNVTFSLSTVIVDNNTDIVRTLVREQSQDLFGGDVQKEKDFVSGLLAHSITRVNQTTGDRENLGIITDGKFSDIIASQKYSANKLKSGTSYVYEISVLFQVPSTMLTTYVQVSTDQITKKTYQYSPLKFLNPVTSRKGVLLTAAGISQKYPGGLLAQNNLGVSKTVEVLLNNFTTKLNTVNASVVGKMIHIVCTCNSTQRDIDHYLVFKLIHGMKSLVGKCQPTVGSNNTKFIYNVLSGIGEMSFTVVPVYVDYSVGDQMSSNIVFVGDF